MAGTTLRLTSERTSFYFILEVKAISRSAANNTSTIEWTYTLKKGAFGGWITFEFSDYTFNIDGQIVTGTIPHGTYEEDTVIATGQLIIPHNIDGTKTIAISAEQDKNMITTNASYFESASGTLTLTKNERKATLISAPSFSDAEQPTIVYSNPAQESATSLKACISLTGAIADIPYREIPKTDTSYTFELTSAEIATLRKAIKTGNKTTVIFYLVSVVDGVTYTSTITQTFTIAEPEPKLAPIVYDTNARTIELTGSNKKLVRYYSNAYFDTGATAVEGATIEYNTITCGSVTLDDYTSNTGTINNIDSNTFYFSATDTRGYTGRDFIVFSEDLGEFIPYVRLTNNLTVDAATPSGTLKFTIKGKYFNGSFGAKSNTMEVEYALQEKGSGDIVWTRLGFVNPTVDNNYNYSYSYTISNGFDYNKQYELTVNVIDELTPVQTTATTVVATPVFDWSDTDFAHHTTVQLDNSKGIYGTTKEGVKIDALNPCNSSGALVLGWGGYNTNYGKTDIMGNKVYISSRDGIVINNNNLADFVIDQASNGVWFYRKWNSGRVELFGYQNISNIACNTALGGWFRTAVQTAPSFPFTVNNPKTVLNYESNGYGALVWLTTLATSSKPADYYLIRPTSSAAITGVVNYYVSGTWK